MFSLQKKKKIKKEEKKSKTTTITKTVQIVYGFFRHILLGVLNKTRLAKIAEIAYARFFLCVKL